MFILTVPKKDQATVVANLKKIPYMSSGSETHAAMKHPDGPELRFDLSGETVTVSVIKNPANEPESEIQKHLETDLNTLSKSTQ